MRKGTAGRDTGAATVAAAPARGSFFDELRRRNVIRLAGLYLVAAWLIVQVAETVLPVFGTPAWVLQTLIVLLALGFVPALVFSWVFELTPAGLKRDRDVPAGTSIGAQTARRMDRMLLAGMVIVVGLIAADRLWPGREKAGSESFSADAELAADKSGAENESDPRAAGASAAPANAIAVLPFVNMSGDAENEYFSDGISEEILNVLAGSPELQVAARTSSFSFKGKNAEVPDIARALNVRLVLEGSVRRQGDRVRITAQLIDAQTGFHRWSQTYDRELTDIFAVQDEIARAIGDALKVGLGDAMAAGGSGTRGTTDVAAYDLYLRGMTLWHGRTTAGMEQAAALFEQATSRDPDFAQAWAGQALTYSILPAYSDALSWEEATPKAFDRAAHALALDPSLPEAYAAMATASLYRLERDTGSALLRRAIALRPSYPTGHHWLAIALVNSGRREEALEAIDHAAALDPRSPVIGENRAYMLLTLGRTDEARAECERVLAFAPDYLACLEYAGFAAIQQKDFDAARAWYGRLFGLVDAANAEAGVALVDALAGRGDRRGMAQRLAALGFNTVTDPTSGNLLEDHVVPLLIVELGEPALALDWIERTSRHFGNSMDWSVMLPGLDPIRCEPRFRAVVARMRTTDPRFEAVCPP